MLKKAGIIVAASAASLLAISPLAFAGDYAGDSSKDAKHQGHDGGVIDKDSKGGLVSGLSGNNVNVPIQICNNNIPVNVLGAQVPVEDGALLNGLTGALGIAGDAKTKSGDSATDQSDSCGQASGSGDSIG
ncbi:hypothetical protein Ae168Ps1_3220c [Pseudonocardia sp. Ae168_Ps1]|uniref:hypothetical protein n=1 Tax=unclassified Pseudonocardia TaxID=2619320 RepID=UPI00094B161A|nr:MULTISPECIES: hypothetical protein [unclassified Pseudonocardia]OLL74822.1 hypothetical protein Ae150APs1_3200c [Pseudonocardia sp. Ae150A_Ps1]OLL80814.1 hypothetical protein Ae168Ps1_3220c [Pseudonocardia sp. Ae168_Ps1]OLL85068.1 hypothetical protein Ae263Ps1_2123 [Pseudonocardia sp. Ae263_Ps1]OLL94915.1 hypothetical protein Ae356Ps1_4812c [Pseudonocardia sp. Ae356_Ps1]